MNLIIPCFRLAAIADAAVAVARLPATFTAVVVLNFIVFGLLSP